MPFSFSAILFEQSILSKKKGSSKQPIKMARRSIYAPTIQQFQKMLISVTKPPIASSTRGNEVKDGKVKM
jgi:hypothetical protein